MLGDPTKRHARDGSWFWSTASTCYCLITVLVKDLGDYTIPSFFVFTVGSKASNDGSVNVFDGNVNL